MADGVIYQSVPYISIVNYVSFTAGYRPITYLCGGGVGGERCASVSWLFTEIAAGCKYLHSLSRCRANGNNPIRVTCNGANLLSRKHRNTVPPYVNPASSPSLAPLFLNHRYILTLGSGDLELTRSHQSNTAG